MTGRSEWVRPFVATTAVVVVVVVLMTITDMEPEPLLVATFVTLLATGAWCVATLSNSIRSPNLVPRAVAVPLTIGADRRVKALRTGILFGRALGGHSTRLHQTLVGLIDDQLQHAHGIDRATDPDRAASIIGPKLTAFVNDPEAPASVASTKELTRIVSLIEQL